MTSKVLTVRVLNDKIYFMICALQGAKNEAIPIHTGCDVNSVENKRSGHGPLRLSDECLSGEIIIDIHAGIILCIEKADVYIAAFLNTADAEDCLGCRFVGIE